MILENYEDLILGNKIDIHVLVLFNHMAVSQLYIHVHVQYNHVLYIHTVQ